MPSDVNNSRFKSAGQRVARDSSRRRIRAPKSDARMSHGLMYTSQASACEGQSCDLVGGSWKSLAKPKGHMPTSLTILLGSAGSICCCESCPLVTGKLSAVFLSHMFECPLEVRTEETARDSAHQKKEAQKNPHAFYCGWSELLEQCSPHKPLLLSSLVSTWLLQVPIRNRDL
jgi:hypothetical protein